MTRKNFFQNNKTKLLLVLTLICALCLSLFAVACNNTTEGDNDKSPNYSYTQTDNEYVSNADFSYGSIDTELTKFPKTSPTGWTKSKDSNNSIGSSSAKSGVINLSSDGWKELMNALYKDSNVIDYVEHQLKGQMKVGDQNYTDVKNFVKAFLKDKNGSEPNSNEIQEYIIENYFGFFKNPDLHEDAKDNFVYMLNNYRLASYQGIGTSQKITSSSEIVLNKGEFGKISVWVKTQNLTEKANGEYGASIRVINKFNGTSQADYVIKNIIAENWTQYTVYVKADENFETTVKVALGLGYGLAGVTEGTVYFDDVQFTHLDENQYNTETDGKNFTESQLNYNDKSAITLNNVQSSIFDMTMDNSSYISNKDVTFTASETISNVAGFDGTPFTDSSVSNSVVSDEKFGNVTELSLNKASYTAKLSSTSFAVANDKYAYVQFFIKNQLSTWGSSDVTVNVYDIFGSEKEIRKAVTTVSTISDEWQKVALVFKNNFTNGGVRTFEIEIVVGPTDVASAKFADEYASGKIYLSPVAVATGDIKQYKDNGEETDNYQLYQLFSTNAVSTALYAGYASDYVDSSDSTVYDFTTAPSDIGIINEKVANVNGYVGVVADHFYIKEDSNNSDINTRTEKDTNGSIAGLINTNYLSTYNTKYGINVANALNHTGDAIQPIMIYNAVADNYGFIGSTQSISSSSYAKVSATVKVVGDAIANVYLVNVAEQQKSVMTFVDFTSDNADKTEYKGEDYKLQLTITEDMMINGWVTVDFYIATGSTAKDFRIEIWNGTRDASQSSAGFVFVKNITINTTGDAFTEPANKNDALSTSGNPLFDESFGGEELTLISHTRAWTELEDEYNEKHPDSPLDSYTSKYIWASNKTFIYAIFNTVDPVKVDPDSNVTEDEKVDAGCTAQTDPSTFWLSFSSIVLGVVLVLAIIALFVKNIRRRRKANKSDAKSHYTVTSRVKTHEKNKKTTKTVIEDATDSANEDDNKVIENIDSIENTSSSEEQDNYVYGEVELFDENEKNNNQTETKE